MEGGISGCFLPLRRSGVIALGTDRSDVGIAPYSARNDTETRCLVPVATSIRLAAAVRSSRFAGLIVPYGVLLLPDAYCLMPDACCLMPIAYFA